MKRDLHICDKRPKRLRLVGCTYNDYWAVLWEWQVEAGIALSPEMMGEKSTTSQPRNPKLIFENGRWGQGKRSLWRWCNKTQTLNLKLETPCWFVGMAGGGRKGAVTGDDQKGSRDQETPPSQGLWPREACHTSRKECQRSWESSLTSRDTTCVSPRVRSSHVNESCHTRQRSWESSLTPRDTPCVGCITLQHTATHWSWESSLTSRDTPCVGARVRC